ncbi:winged helix-turn-helix transcriptional regulator [Phyllobacterium sp. 628]|uniref:ArsR/SmtB family transcription factor n=1 Tax=Phyllobacterium sp. 628 TaxID=2718938 RepID=UPI00166226C4|nr:winged helix-turn-helix domain-containing protein [Phyllobacterium sp. 628]QND51660.1 winged helix-turn-helix transcriptional regulator [Phyllobacterium sp. 628]
MTHPLFHPDAEEISLPAVLTALGDETRLNIIAILARNGERAMTCGQFLELGSKTALSYHVAKLREAGVINVRPDGTKRLLTLRRIDLESRFPGFLDSIVTSAGTLPLPKHQEMADAAETSGETEWT